MANGQLIYGYTGFAGELGHVTVSHTGRVCGCGRKGCLETYVSATGIKRTIFKLMADSMEESEFRHITFNDLTAEMITKAALNGDPLAIEAYEYTGMLLGHALADAVTITSPEAIFLFGGEVIRGFVFALLFGVLISTYSTVFTATPIAYDLIRRDRKQA